MTQPVSRWLLGEGAGTTASDYISGADFDLTTFLGNGGVWASDAQGNGLTGLEAIGGPTFNVDATALSWNGTMQACFEVQYFGAVPVGTDVYPFEATGAAGAPFSGLSLNLRSDGTARLRASYNGITGNYLIFTDTWSGIGRVVLHGVFQSTQAAIADRMRLYVDGVRQVPIGGGAAPPLNATLDYSGADAFVSIVRRSPGFVASAAWYPAAVPSDGELAQITAALNANHDIPPSDSSALFFGSVF